MLEANILIHLERTLSLIAFFLGLDYIASTMGGLVGGIVGNIFGNEESQGTI